MFSESWHRRIFLFGIISLATGLLFGALPTSIPQIILGANWFLEKKYVSKIKSLYTNTFFWVLSSLFLLHLVGLIYTSNISAGLNDIKTKIPLLIFAIIFLSTKPLNKKEFELFFKCFFASVILSSIFCFIVYMGLTNKHIIDVRDASIFISHIRFSLIITFTVIGIFYFLKSKTEILIGSLSIIWLVFFMYKLEMATGIFLLLSVSFILLINYVFKKANNYLSLVILLLLSISCFYGYKKVKTDLLMFNKNLLSKNNVLLQKTLNGRVYLQDTLFNLAENGNLITINICDDELQKEWNNSSKLKYYKNDNNGNSLRFTILRYLSSKGLTKDSAGLSNLNKPDIIKIENGISNFNYSFNSGLSHKWREIIWEYTNYKRHENPSGHTLTMRLEFWKTAFYIIKQNPFFGVGTGDVQQSFNLAYDQMHSKLLPQWRLRCHNQYLAITVAFGFFGFCIFIFYLLYPIIKLNSKLHQLYWPFILILAFSFLTEDTLESQAGLTFFGIFNTLFIWLASNENKTSTHKV